MFTLYKRRTWLYLMVDGKYRCWEDFEKFGFLSAGHDSPASAPLRKLRPRDTVYAFSPPHGYFAQGTVISAAVRPREFMIRGPFVHLQDGGAAGDVLPLDEVGTKRLCLRNDQDTDLSELIVGMKWESILPRAKAKIAPAIHIPDIAVVELEDEQTRNFLTHAFARKANGRA